VAGAGGREALNAAECAADGAEIVLSQRSAPGALNWTRRRPAAGENL